jgi:hypothetical protein
MLIFIKKILILKRQKQLQKEAKNILKIPIEIVLMILTLFMRVIIYQF